MGDFDVVARAVEAEGVGYEALGEVGVSPDSAVVAAYQVNGAAVPRPIMPAGGSTERLLPTAPKTVVKEYCFASSSWVRSCTFTLASTSSPGVSLGPVAHPSSLVPLQIKYLGVHEPDVLPVHFHIAAGLNQEQVYARLVPYEHAQVSRGS